MKKICQADGACFGGLRCDLSTGGLGGSSFLLFFGAGLVSPVLCA